MRNKTPRDIQDALTGAGRRVTQKRALVLSLLRKEPGHPDADTLFIKAREVDPRISLATVYRTLSLLKKTGCVEEHRLGESHGHFEPASKTSHVHFTCHRCGRVIEFNNPLLERLKTELKRELKVELREFHIHAGGLCARCRKAGD